MPGLSHSMACEISHGSGTEPMPPALEGRFVTTEPPEKGAFSREVTSGSCSPIDCSLPGSFPGKNEVWFYFGKDKLVLKYAPDLF